MTENDAAVHPHTAGELDAATPTDRDRWAATLRVGSLFVVVLGLGVSLLAVIGRSDQAADQSAPAAVRTAAIAD